RCLSDWSSDVCSSDLEPLRYLQGVALVFAHDLAEGGALPCHRVVGHGDQVSRVAFVDQLENRAAGEDRDIIAVRLNGGQNFAARSEEHTSELQSLRHL